MLRNFLAGVEGDEGYDEGMRYFEGVYSGIMRIKLTGDYDIEGN